MIFIDQRDFLCWLTSSKNYTSPISEIRTLAYLELLKSSPFFDYTHTHRHPTYKDTTKNTPNLHKANSNAVVVWRLPFPSRDARKCLPGTANTFCCCFSDFNLYYVAAHEVGHSLGLGHDNDIGSLMFPSYNSYRDVLLSQRDISAIQALYGEHKEKHLGPAIGGLYVEFK